MTVFENVLDQIGNTPLVDVSVLSPNRQVRILAKLESQNPFGSVKDRIAKLMLDTAEKEGRLSPGQTIVEPSSGNTGRLGDRTAIMRPKLATITCAAMVRVVTPSSVISWTTLRTRRFCLIALAR